MAKIFTKTGTVSGHVVLWIPKFIYLIIAFLSVIFLLRILVVTQIDSAEAEARILINRLIYSPNDISYLDADTNRNYPGIIDYKKFISLENFPNELDTKTISYGQYTNLIAAKLILKNSESNKEDVAFYNKENYEFWEPRILSTVKGGTGSVKSFAEQKYVLIKEQNKLSSGLLKIQVIVRTG